MCVQSSHKYTFSTDKCSCARARYCCLFLYLDLLSSFFGSFRHSIKIFLLLYVHKLMIYIPKMSLFLSCNWTKSQIVHVLHLLCLNAVTCTTKFFYQFDLYDYRHLQPKKLKNTQKIARNSTRLHVITNL